MNLYPSCENVSSPRVEEAIGEIDLEDADTNVLPLFYELRGALHKYAIEFEFGSDGPILMYREAVFEKAESLRTAVRRRIKELES
jgi:hypothetical protein